MKKLSLIKFIFVFAVLISMNAVAQDVHFSQFGQTPQLINPGATGVYDGDFRAFLNYRSQWGNVGNGYKTYAASFDAPIKFKKGRGRGKGAYLGVGLNFYRDVAGASNFGTTQTALSVSGILPVSDQHTFSVGLQGALGQNSVDLNSLTWGSQFNGEAFDPTVNSNELYGLNSTSFFDLGAGLFYEFKTGGSTFLGSDVSSFNVGISGYHLNKPKQEFLSNTKDALPRKIVTQFSATIDLGDIPLSLYPSVFYAVQSNNKEITPGLLFKLEKGHDTKYSGMFKSAALYLGAHYRVGDAIIPELYLEFTDYMVGISYDFNNSDFSNVRGGASSIELSFRYIHHPKALQRASFR